MSANRYAGDTCCYVDNSGNRCLEQGVLACARCGIARYCGPVHSADDWPTHKPDCNRFRKTGADPNRLRKSVLLIGYKNDQEGLLRGILTVLRPRLAALETGSYQLICQNSTVRENLLHRLSFLIPGQVRAAFENNAGEGHVQKLFNFARLVPMLESKVEGNDVSFSVGGYGSTMAQLTPLTSETLRRMYQIENGFGTLIQSDGAVAEFQRLSDAVFNQNGNIRERKLRFQEALGALCGKIEENDPDPLVKISVRKIPIDSEAAIKYLYTAQSAAVGKAVVDRCVELVNNPRQIIVFLENVAYKSAKYSLELDSRFSIDPLSSTVAVSTAEGTRTRTRTRNHVNRKRRRTRSRK